MEFDFHDVYLKQKQLENKAALASLRFIPKVYATGRVLFLEVVHLRSGFRWFHWNVHNHALATSDFERIKADILAPCALGGVFGEASTARVRAKIVCGAANNQLATPADGDALQRRGICYLPDYLVNAGGIISVAREYRGEGEETAVMAEVSKIAERVEELLQRVQTADSTPARDPIAAAEVLPAHQGLIFGAKE